MTVPGPQLDAGDLGSWVSGFRLVLAEGGGSDVPCGECTACCRSAQFVEVEPDEADTLAHIPSAVLVPAPGRPAGHQVLGFDGAGRCPMLGATGCRIYEHRPRACRVYDCRVFAATGTEPDQPLVAERVRQWRFGGDPSRRAALVEEAARLRSEHPDRPATAIALRALVESAGGGGHQSRTSAAMADSTPFTKRPDSSVE